jgi:cell fate regulator YaaT (PSP1 superfamily)
MSDWNENMSEECSGRDESICINNSQKLESYDWLCIHNPESLKYWPDIVELRFKNTRKAFYRNTEKLPLGLGDAVVVETPTGHDLGYVSLCSDLVSRQLRIREYSVPYEEIPKILRMAHIRDLRSCKEARDMEYPTLIKAREIARSFQLKMKINDVEFQSDKKKATFFYTAEGRIDFRELIKEYAKNFRIKIEMRQIGIRQEAGRVGGIADCGRELCCSTWLSTFTSVPTIAAKQQNLYMNPSKLSGQCGRLKCCLNYELDLYIEALEDFPDENAAFKTTEGDAVIFKIDILKKCLWLNIKDGNINPRPVALDSVKKIIELNKKKIRVDLEKFVVTTMNESDSSNLPYSFE